MQRLSQFFDWKRSLAPLFKENQAALAYSSPALPANSHVPTSSQGPPR